MQTSNEMKYTKKLYYTNFTSARVVRPTNQFVRLFTDTLFSPWYVILFVIICAFYPSALFADSYRFLKLQYIKSNHENLKKSIINPNN